MKFNNIYIISWFGNESIIDKRLKFHDNQLSWALQNDLKPIVLSQNYKKEYYRDNVTYIDHVGQVLRFGEARDILLKHFYDSDEDFAIFADNDHYLYQGKKYGHNDKFVEIMRNIPIDNFSHVDCFYPLHPGRVPFTKDLQKNKQIDIDNLRMKPGYIACGFFVLKNLKKHHNKEIYFDSNFVLPDRSILPCEDQEFPINLIHNDLTCFLCPSLIKRDEGHNSISTWSPTDRKKWEQRTIDGQNYIAEKYNLPKVSKLQSSSTWLKHLKLRNHKLRDTKVYFHKQMFNEFFKHE